MNSIAVREMNLLAYRAWIIIEKNEQGFDLDA
jgi:hypothetical protein